MSLSLVCINGAGALLEALPDDVPALATFTALKAEGSLHINCADWDAAGASASKCLITAISARIDVVKVVFAPSVNRRALVDIAAELGWVYTSKRVDIGWDVTLMPATGPAVWRVSIDHGYVLLYNVESKENVATVAAFDKVVSPFYAKPYKSNLLDVKSPEAFTCQRGLVVIDDKIAATYRAYRGCARRTGQPYLSIEDCGHEPGMEAGMAHLAQEACRVWANIPDIKHISFSMGWARDEITKDCVFDIAEVLGWSVAVKTSDGYEPADRTRVFETYYTLSISPPTARVTRFKLPNTGV